MENAKVNKTSDIAAYMKEYRLRNLDRYKQYDRNNYLKKKYKKILTPEEMQKFNSCLAEAYEFKKAMLILENL